MKEEQLNKATLIADLITRTIRTKPGFGESATLTAWTAEQPGNQMLLDELTNPDILNQLLYDYYKYKSALRLKKLHQRIFGSKQNLTNCKS